MNNTLLMINNILDIEFNLIYQYLLKDFVILSENTKVIVLVPSKILDKKASIQSLIRQNKYKYYKANTNFVKKLLSLV